jgi:hypothetical protein
MQVESPWADASVLERITAESLFPELADVDGWIDADCEPVSRQWAMTVPSVAASRHRVVGTLARLPIVAESGGVPWTGDTNLFDQPDPAEPHVRTMTKTLDDIFFSGTAWWAITRANSAGFPVDAVHVPLADLAQDADGWPGLDGRFIGWLRRTGRAVLDHPAPAVPPGTPWLIEIVGPHAGLCNFGGRAIRSALSLDRSTAAAARNPVPSLELHQTSDASIQDDDVRDMIDSWEKARRRNAVGFTNNAVELRTHGVQPEQLLIDGRNQQAVEIARLAGIPAASIDAGIPGASLTYANLVDRLRDLIDFGLQPYAAAYCGRLSMDDVVPHGVKAKLDYTELMPDVPTVGSPTERATNE